MSGIRERLAEVLREHRWMAFDISWDVCTGCEWRGKSRDAHTAHLADVLLSLPGIAIVEVPQPDSARYEGDEHEPQDRLCWLPGDDFEVSVWNQGEVQRCGYGWGDDEPLSAPEARTIAATLLAAANAAEATQ